MSLFILFFPSASATDKSYNSEYVLLDSRKGIKQPIAVHDVESAVATVVLFAGGDGYLNLSEEGVIQRLGTNFLLRSIDLFLKNDLRVVVFETPSNKAGGYGLLGGYRSSKAHANDIAVVIDYLETKYDEPIWLIGTSRGSSSVANAAIRLESGVDGIIITAPLTQANKHGSFVTAMKLKKITIPVFLAAHKDDLCWVTPSWGVKSIKRRLKNSPAVEAIIFDQPTGLTQGRVCGGMSAHGFLDIEPLVIKKMAEFIEAHIHW